MGLAVGLASRRKSLKDKLATPAAATSSEAKMIQTGFFILQTLLT
jgi:hypothetical protein